MIRRLGYAVYAAFLLLFLLAQATLIIAWIPSAPYTALAAGTAYRLVDSVNSTALRIDQLGAGAAVSGTDQLEACQGCGSSTSSVRILLSAVATYITGVITGQQNAWSAGQQLVPFALTDASSVAVNFANGNIQTLLRSRSSSKIANPTGVSSGDRGTLTLEFTQPASGGPDDLSWDTAWWFPSGTPPIQANGGLSAANNAVDMYTCNVRNISGTVTALCPFNGSSNFASSSSFLLRNNNVNSGTSCGAVATCSVTITNSMSGDLRVVPFFFCCTGSVAAPTSVTDGTNTCTVDTASFNNGATGNASTGFAYCPKIVGSASATITVTWGATASCCAQVGAIEFVPSTVSPLASIGNTAGGTSGANPSLSTNGATTQAGQLVIAMLNSGSTGPTASTCTQIGSTAYTTMIVYSLPGSTGVATCGFTAVSSNYDGSITSFLHY